MTEPTQAHRNWLKRQAELENGSAVSVGGDEAVTNDDAPMSKWTEAWRRYMMKLS